MPKPDLQIFAPHESVGLRMAYLDKFIDTSSEHYRKHIAAKLQFSDGERYEGYLWDCLRGGERITEQRFTVEVARHPQVCMMSDDSSRDRVIGAPLWPFPSNSVVQLSSTLLLQLLPALPEDLYVFDILVSWTLILTHEHDDQSRICAAIGIPPVA